MDLTAKATRTLLLANDEAWLVLYRGQPQAATTGGLSAQDLRSRSGHCD